MYSCGSLAPKMSRGDADRVPTSAAPWCVGDGCVHLVAEMSAVAECVPAVLYLPTQYNIHHNILL